MTSHVWLERPLLSLCFIVFFFFSSRRRHTRWNCDWSSDVCSSDLPARRRQLAAPGGVVLEGRDTGTVVCPRSEERRVGKECRSRWGPYHEKKNGRERVSGADAAHRAGWVDEVPE